MALKRRLNLHFMKINVQELTDTPLFGFLVIKLLILAQNIGHTCLLILIRCALIVWVFAGQEHTAFRFGLEEVSC